MKGHGKALSFSGSNPSDIFSSLFSSQLFCKFFKREETIEQARRTVISEVIFDFNQLSVSHEIKYFSWNF